MGARPHAENHRLPVRTREAEHVKTDARRQRGVVGADASLGCSRFPSQVESRATRWAGGRKRRLWEPEETGNAGQRSLRRSGTESKGRIYNMLDLMTVHWSGSILDFT